MKSLSRTIRWFAVVALLVQPSFGTASPQLPAQQDVAVPYYQTLGLRGPQSAPEPMAVTPVQPVQLAARPTTHPRPRMIAPQPVALVAPPAKETALIAVSETTALSVEPIEGIQIQQQDLQLAAPVVNIELNETDTALATVSEEPQQETSNITVQEVAANPLSIEVPASVPVPAVQIAEAALPQQPQPPVVVPAQPAQVTAPVSEPTEEAVRPAPQQVQLPPPPPLPPLVTRVERPAPTSRALTAQAPVAAVTLPYQHALRCVANGLSEQQRRDAFTVGLVTNDAGQFAINGPGASGSIGPLSGSPILRMALFQGGVTVVRTDPQFRDIYGFQSDQGRRGDLGDGQVRTVTDAQSGESRQTMSIPYLQGRLSPAEYLIEGNIVSIDNGGGRVLEGGISGFRAGSRDIRLTILMTVTVTRMPLGPTVGGEVIDSFPILIELRGRETRAGFFEFLGGTPLAVSLDYRNMDRQAMQYLTQVAWQGAGYLVLMRHYNGDQPGSPLAQCDSYLPFTTVSQ